MPFKVVFRLFEVVYFFDLVLLRVLFYDSLALILGRYFWLDWLIFLLTDFRTKRTYTPLFFGVFFSACV